MKNSYAAYPNKAFPFHVQTEGTFPQNDNHPADYTLNLKVGAQGNALLEW